MGSLFAGLQRFGLGRLAAIIGGAAGALAVLVGVMMNLGSEPDALLFSSLDLKEASEITSALSQAGVKYAVKGDGSTILVPRDKVASARLLLAGKGLPTAASVGYELFDQSSALGQTEFVQNLNMKRALEGELARTIRSLKGVDSVRVHLALPQRQLFEDSAAAPQASVVVGLSGRDLGADQVRSIRNLVAGAVPNLKPDHVGVVDETGKTLAAIAEDDGGLSGDLTEGQKTETEAAIRKAVMDVVAGVVGPGKARVQVHADLDLSRVTLQEEKFDPDGQVVRSTTTSDEKSTDSSGDGGVVGAAQNIPGGAAAGAAGASGSSRGANQETTNYEISKTTRTEVREAGAIKRLSVAVAVDGVTTPGKNGVNAYRPRTAEEMQRIEQLVKAAVGFDAQRGDLVTVSNVRFDRTADGMGGTPAKPPLFDFTKNDILRGVELAILGVVGLLTIFLVLRPLAKGGGVGGALQAARGPAAALTAMPGGGPPSAQLAYAAAGPEASSLLPPPAEIDQRIDIARIEGQVKVSSVKKVSEFVERHPDESVSILRNWLHES